MLIEVFAVILIVTVVAFSKSWRAAAIRGGLICLIVLLIEFLWLFYPFSPERWQNASPFTRRLLARNFLNLHEYQGKTQSEIERLFGAGKFHDEWQYYVRTDQSVTGFSGINVNFADGKVKSVDTWFSKPIEGSSAYSSVEWVAADEAKRSSMITDMIANKVVIGKTKSEVLGELGLPNRWSVISYYLGMFPWLGEMDGYGLEFEFDESLKIKTAGIVQY